MKTINDYINEKFQVSKDYKRQYAYTPKDKDELIDCIIDKLDKEGYGTKDNPLDLNDIDTSNITDMSYLFDIDDGELQDLSKNGHFDISDWDVYNVINMKCIFYGSSFDDDISNWDVSNVKTMTSMFYNSAFSGKNGGISKWNVRNVEDMTCMFCKTPFNGNISDWDVRNVEGMERMFYSSQFNGDISDWDVSKVRNMSDMFVLCPLEKNKKIPKWFYE